MSTIITDKEVAQALAEIEKLRKVKVVKRMDCGLYDIMKGAREAENKVTWNDLIIFLQSKKFVGDRSKASIMSDYYRERDLRRADDVKVETKGKLLLTSNE